MSEGFLSKSRCWSIAMEYLCHIPRKGQAGKVPLPRPQRHGKRWIGKVRYVA
jgi:hypothetical protein